MKLGPFTNDDDGSLYRCVLPEEQKKKVQWIILILSLPGLVVYLYAATRELPANIRGLPSTVGGAVLIAYIFLVVGIIRWFILKDPINKKALTRSVVYIRGGSAGGICTAGASVVLQTLSAFENKFVFTEGMLTAALFLVVTVLFIITYRIISNVIYMVEDNGNLHDNTTV